MSEVRQAGRDLGWAKAVKVSEISSILDKFQRSHCRSVNDVKLGAETGTHSTASTAVSRSTQVGASASFYPTLVETTNSVRVCMGHRKLPRISTPLNREPVRTVRPL